MPLHIESRRASDQPLTLDLSPVRALCRGDSETVQMRLRATSSTEIVQYRVQFYKVVDL